MKKASLLSYFLSTVCSDDWYPPLDGSYVRFTYGHDLTLKQVRSFWRAAAARIREAPDRRPIGLYLHWPFCLSRCRFCFCDAYAPERVGEQRRYAALLREEIESLRDLFKGVAFTSVYFGGGTPSFAPDDVLEELFTLIQGSFTLDPSAQLYFEASPSTLTDAKLRLLRRHGVNRITLGVQSLSREVLLEGNRLGQKSLRIEELAARIRADGIVLNIDLMAGLDGQSPAMFMDDLKTVISWNPDMLHLFQFDPRPHVPSAAGAPAPEARRDEIRRALETGGVLLRRIGYQLAHEAWDTPELERADDRQDTEARRYNASILGIGANALSHAFGSGWYQHPIYGGPGRAATACRTWSGYAAGLDEEMRAYVLRNADTCGRFSLSGFRRLFAREALETSFLQRPLRRLLDKSQAVIEGDWYIFRLGPQERMIALKGFYSIDVISRVVKSRAAQWREFNARYGGAPDAELRSLLRGRERARYASHRYFRAPLSVH